MALEKGWELPDSWIGYSQHSFETLPLRTDVLTAAEVLKFRDAAFMSYFKNPRYLELVEHKFGTDVLRHIEQMTQIQLKRKINS